VFKVSNRQFNATLPSMYTSGFNCASRFMVRWLHESIVLYCYDKTKPGELPAEQTISSREQQEKLPGNLCRVLASPAALTRSLRPLLWLARPATICFSRLSICRVKLLIRVAPAFVFPINFHSPSARLSLSRGSKECAFAALSAVVAPCPKLVLVLCRFLFSPVRLWPHKFPSSSHASLESTSTHKIMGETREN
jgi:hypothetical protein